MTMFKAFTAGGALAFHKSPFMRLVIAVLSVLFGAAAMAADGTMLWINGSANWSDSGSWRKGEIAQAGGVATLALQASGTLNQNVSGLTLRGMSVSAGTASFSGYPITLTNSPFLNVATTGSKLYLPILGQGVLRKYGAGQLELANSTFTGFDAVSVDEGTLVVSSNLTEAVTGSTLLLNGGALVFAPTLTSGQAGLAYGATNASATFAYGPAVSWLHVNKGSGSSATLALGGAGDGFFRTNRGVVVIAPAAGVSALGVTEKVLVNGTAPVVSNGMVDASIVGCDLSGVNFPFHFLTYDSGNGFVPAAYTDGVNGGASSIADVTNNVTVADDKHVHALRMNDRRTLTISAGKTLTVGDGTHPAGIIFNSQGANVPGPTITGGTIDFGTSEGVIWGAGASANYQASTLSSALAGQNGVTLAARNAKELFWLNVAGTNTYSGDTRIMGGRVTMVNPGVFSTGDIYVYGNRDKGAQLMLGDLTLSNKLHLAGFGVGGAHKSAVLDYAGVTQLTLDNTVTLIDDVGFLVAVTGSIKVNKAVGGKGSLYFSSETASGTLTLNATNTYAGMTVVQSGILSLGPEGSFGQGDVTNNSTVTFNNTATLLVTNNIGGTGSFVQKGNGPLLFTGDQVSLASFDAGVSPVGVNGSNTWFQMFLGYGDVSAVAGAVNPKPLEIGKSGTNFMFNGCLKDGAAVLGLTKVGTGTLILTRPQSYSGPTVIREGTLKLQAGLTRPPAAGLSYWLDAADASKVLTDSSQTVTNWTDSSAAGLRFKKTADRPLPEYAQNAINGKPAVYFAGNTNRIASTVSLSHKSLFIVNKPTGYEAMDGIWGQDNGDFGIRTSSSTSWQNSPGNPTFFFNDLPTFIINGQNTNNFVQNVPHILYAQRTAGKTCNVALGNYYYTAPQKRAYKGYIGEVIAYDRVLSEEERWQIEDYLAEKWLGNGLHRVNQDENLLPPTTSLSMENRAVLDLNGISQTLASLSGEGMITNSSDAVVTLTVTGASSFSGVIAGNIRLVKTGSSTADLTVRVASTNDVVLNGGTVHLAPYHVEPIQAGLTYWLDASATNTVATNETGAVTNWSSRLGNGIAFKQPVDRRYVEPAYVTNAIYGRNAVRFAGTNWMYTPVSCKVQTLFFVTKTWGFQSLAGVWAPALTADVGLRQDNATTWRDGFIGDIFYDGVYRVNGAATRSFVASAPYVFCGQTALPKTSVNNALGGYYISTSANRCYIGDIGEVLAYDRFLSVEEVRNVEAYLSAKWLTAGGLDTSDAIFSQTGQLILTNNVTVDLGGTSQTVHNLSGTGSFQNGNLALDGTLTVRVSPSGTYDVIAVDGNFHLEQVTLNVVGLEFLDETQSHTILSATGQITGGIAATNLPKGWSVRVTDTSIQLVPERGTLFLLK